MGDSDSSQKNQITQVSGCQITKGAICSTDLTHFFHKNHPSTHLEQSKHNCTTFLTQCHTSHTVFHQGWPKQQGTGTYFPRLVNLFFQFFTHNPGKFPSQPGGPFLAKIAYHPNTSRVQISQPLQGCLFDENIRKSRRCRLKKHFCLEF